MNIIFHINLYLMYLIYFNIKKYFNFITAEYFQKQMIYFKRLIIFIRQSIYIDIIYLRMLHNIDRTNTLYPPVQISGCNHCRLNSSRCEVVYDQHSRDDRPKRIELYATRTTHKRMYLELPSCQRLCVQRML